MIARQQTSYLANEEKCFLRALLYFDIFNYPLTTEEMVRFSPVAINLYNEQLLERLVEKRILFRFGDFYSIQNNAAVALRRTQGNALAERKLKTAAKFSRIIASFPFVRAVLLSGSISKNFMDDKSDIDYFIITGTNRLWIVRTALVIFRRIFLFNSLKNLCTNYFIDTENLEIKQKNIFTAIELCTLKPMIGRFAIEDFQSANQWTNSFLPNSQFENAKVQEGSSFFKKGIEKILSFQAFSSLNNWLMQKTILHWKRKYGANMDEHDFEIAFRSTTGVSKSHPQFFQKKVLTRFEQKIKDFEIRNGIDLTL